MINMFLGMLLLGFNLGAFIIICLGSYYEQKHLESEIINIDTRAPMTPRIDRGSSAMPPFCDLSCARNGVPNSQRWTSRGSTIPYALLHRRPILHFEPQRIEETAKALVQNWRKSVAGLVKLAERNLVLARMRFSAQSEDYDGAVRAASTSTENMARALIHCYGGKPDLDAGQEEVLRMLMIRFKGDARKAFEKALDNVTYISKRRGELGEEHSQHESQIRVFDKVEAERTLLRASETFETFKRTIADHFAEEIKESLSACEYPLSLPLK